MYSIKNFLAVSCVLIATYLYQILNQPVIKMCELEKCPYCYGTDLCDSFNKHQMNWRLTDVFAFIFNNKNVFNALYKDDLVVLKKLGHDFEIDNLDVQICSRNNLKPECNVAATINDTNDYEMLILDVLSLSNDEFVVKNFKICSLKSAKVFLNLLTARYAGVPHQTALKYIWTTLQLNAEPLVLQLLKPEDGWPVPQYYGACGRVIVEQHCGLNLNDYKNFKWTDRAFLALQLLQAAKQFTESHATFRFYLTDVSPDNIAVNKDLKVLTSKLISVNIVDIALQNVSVERLHQSKDFDVSLTEFAFSEQEICLSDLSDHNYYAVCKLLLSKDAPWPMMQGGLLHSPPSDLLTDYSELFKYIQICTNPAQNVNRFVASERIINILNKIKLQYVSNYNK